MMRILMIFLGFLLLMGNVSEVQAASPKAAALRQANGLVPFTPSEKFLSGNFVADEMNPTVIFGAVKAFAASRKCPTAWLIEEDVKKRLPGPGGPDNAVEFTVYLEEDCPDKVVYYVFVDQSGLTPQQWIEWREKFHKSKAEPTYGSTKSKLDQACKDGCGVGAELRFLQKDMEIMTKSPEEFLRVDLKYTPIYDLNLGKKISK
ncbi:MAG: hypothetical protein FJ134_09350 [Deltaproteobacteria bacterium]|nr:hypothetical protein [Deltaproteobacteria bacterium]